MYRYYCIMHPPVIRFPRPIWCCDMKTFDERIYIPEIDRMAWGWVEYKEELTPQEIADYELIMQPRGNDL